MYIIKKSIKMYNMTQILLQQNPSPNQIPLLTLLLTFVRYLILFQAHVCFYVFFAHGTQIYCFKEQFLLLPPGLVFPLAFSPGMKFFFFRVADFLPEKAFFISNSPHRKKSPMQSQKPKSFRSGLWFLCRPRF